MERQVKEQDTTRRQQALAIEDEEEKGDLSDLLQELRVLLPGVQTLTAFLIILPFNQGFGRIQQSEQWIYIATFVCSISSLVLFTAPAAQHRLERPLRDRERFKHDATRLIIVGMAPLSFALILATHLVVTQVVGRELGIAVPALVAGLIVLTWWLIPLLHRRKNAATLGPG